jgi:hypothetical protein
LTYFKNAFWERELGFSFDFHLDFSFFLRLFWERIPVEWASPGLLAFKASHRAAKSG